NLRYLISQSKKLTIITATVENRLDNKSLGELRRVSQAFEQNIILNNSYLKVHTDRTLLGKLSPSL
ncbi:MAG: hypothetical protein ACOVO7_19900, partial [Microcystis aeruginosa]